MTKLSENLQTLGRRFIFAGIDELFITEFDDGTYRVSSKNIETYKVSFKDALQFVEALDPSKYNVVYGVSGVK